MRALGLASILIIGMTYSAEAVSFTNVVNGLWNSGLSNSAVLLTAASADSHFILMPPSACQVPTPPASCNGFGPNAMVVVGPSTNGTWPTGNGTSSQWIGPIADQTSVGANGVFSSPTDFYVYRLIFNLTSLGLWGNTANVTLRWVADNNTNSAGATANSHIRVCAVGSASDPVCGTNSIVTNSLPGAQNVSSFDAAPVINIGSSYFSAGLMAMDFIVYNSVIMFGENPTGLRVEFLTATADGVPEPQTLSLFGLGLAALGLLRKKAR